MIIATKNVAAQSAKVEHNPEVLLDFIIAVFVPIIVYVNIKERKEIKEIIITLASLFFILVKTGLFVWFSVKKYQNTGDFFFIRYLITILACRSFYFIVNQYNYKFYNKMSLKAFTLSNIGLLIQLIFFGIYISRDYYDNNDYLFVLVPILLFDLCANIRYMWIMIKKSSDSSSDSTSEYFEWYANVYSQTLTVIDLTNSILAMLILDPGASWIKIYLTIAFISSTLLHYNINIGNLCIANMQIRDYAYRNRLAGCKPKK